MDERRIETPGLERRLDHEDDHTRGLEIVRLDQDEFSQPDTCPLARTTSFSNTGADDVNKDDCSKPSVQSNQICGLGEISVLAPRYRGRACGHHRFCHSCRLSDRAEAAYSEQYQVRLPALRIGIQVLLDLQKSHSLVYYQCVIQHSYRSDSKSTPRLACFRVFVATTKNK